MAIDQKQMLQAVYDAIFDALTTAPSGLGNGKPIADRSRTYLTLALPGNPIDVSQFANEWSPTNPTGSVSASENFSNFTDSIPVLSPLHVPSGNSLDLTYGEIVNANVTPPPDDANAKEAYQRAFDLLYTDGVDYDDQGRQVTVKVESPIYRNYKNKYAAYNASVLSYMTNYLQFDLSRPEDQRKWSVIAPSLQSPVDIAWRDLQAARPGVVETAVATLGQYEASSLSGIFSRARQTYEQTKRGSLVQPGLFWHLCEAFPGNWFAESAAVNFAQLTLVSERLRINESSNFSSWSGGASANWGLWSVGGSASHTSEQHDMSTETSSMKISFRLGKVEVRRRWLNPSLLAWRGWNVAGRPAGGYSNGQSNNNDGVFALLPVSFIVARDIQISANWGSTDLHMASQSTSASASVGWGPFSLSGSYSNSSSTRTFNSSFDGTTLTVPGIQVIAWISNIVPFSPPNSGVGPSPQPVSTTALTENIRKRGNPYYSPKKSESHTNEEYVTMLGMPSQSPAPQPTVRANAPAVLAPSAPVLSKWVNAEKKEK